MIQYARAKLKKEESEKKGIVPLLFRILIIFRVRIKITAHKNILVGIYPGAYLKIETGREEIVFHS